MLPKDWLAHVGLQAFVSKGFCAVLLRAPFTCAEAVQKGRSRRVTITITALLRELEELFELMANTYALWLSPLRCSPPRMARDVQRARHAGCIA